jgi:5-formyltetrahydrofolate cyclo-ligase
MNKSSLRKFYLEKRKNLAPAERAEKSALVAERFFRSFDLIDVRFLHCFVPIEKFGEIDTHLIFKRIWREFPRTTTLAPRVNFSSNVMESCVFAPEVSLAENAWQIREPIGCEIIEPEKIDAVLIPLLCFDLRGYRVGYGKGFYDRFLLKCRADCLKIGLSFFEPIAEITDARSFDVKLDACVTPENVYQFSE